MLLSVEVALYTPRFAVLDVQDGKARIMYTGCCLYLEDGQEQPATRAPAGTLLSELSDRLQFILAAYPIDHAVWVMRTGGRTSKPTACMALGVLLMTLEQAGLPVPQELRRSRIQLLLTGRSKAPAALAEACAMNAIRYWKDEYRSHWGPVMAGGAWLMAQGILERSMIAGDTVQEQQVLKRVR